MRAIYMFKAKRSSIDYRRFSIFVTLTSHTRVWALCFPREWICSGGTANCFFSRSELGFLGGAPLGVR